MATESLEVLSALQIKGTDRKRLLRAQGPGQATSTLCQCPHIVEILQSQGEDELNIRQLSKERWKSFHTKESLELNLEEGAAQPTPREFTQNKLA